MRAPVSRRTVFASVAVVALAVALVAAGALTSRPESRRATGDNRVVATLQQTGRAYPQALRDTLQAARADPGDLALAKRAARALIDEGRDRGDSRLVGGAVGLLRPFADSADAETLYLEATARQYQHDFPGALALLDRAVVLDPVNVNSVLSRAFIQTVLGRFDIAMPDCRRVGAMGQAEVASLCASTVGLLTAQRADIARGLERMLAVPGRLDAALVPWATGLLGEIAMLEGRDAEAKRYLGEVVAADPTVVRERLLLADVLLRQDEAGRALEILAQAPDIDGVLVRRVLAARMLGQGAVADTAATELARRVRLNLDLGLRAHAREETMYFLLIAGDPQMALERAKVNWALQHEIEDAQLLLDAAGAAGQPAEAGPVLDWIAEQDVTVPTLRVPQAVGGAAP